MNSYLVPGKFWDTLMLLALQFKAEQTLGIHRKLEDIFSDNQTDRNIINFAFLKYSAEAISKIAVESYKKDIQSFTAKSVKRKKKNKDLISDPPPDVDQIIKSPADGHQIPRIFLVFLTVINI